MRFGVFIVSALFVWSLLSGISFAQNKVVVIPLIEKTADPIPTVKSLTGRLWMDRNLGATRKAQGIDDVQAYGDLYQWGRPDDGHEERQSGTTPTASANDIPGHGSFIKGNHDWRSPSRHVLWQPPFGGHDPCPTGFRLPLQVEWQAEFATWTHPRNANAAYTSRLALPAAGVRAWGIAEVEEAGISAVYWSLSPSNTDGTKAVCLYYTRDVEAETIDANRANGASLRCIKRD